MFVGGPICNESELVRATAWHRTGGKPFPESMMAQYTDTYMCHLYTVGYPEKYRLFNENVFEIKNYDFTKQQ